MEPSTSSSPSAAAQSRAQSSPNRSTTSCSCAGNIKINLPKHFTKKCIAFLHALCHADVQQRNGLLRTADKNLIRCICECALNILKGRVGLKNKEKNKLSKHKQILRKLVDKINNSTRGKQHQQQQGGKKSTVRTSAGWKKKKRLLLQSGGGFLPFLLAPIINNILSKILE